MATEPDVDSLAACEAVRRLRASYTHHIDSGEWTDWAALFTEDAWYGIADTEGCRGREEILAFARETVSDLYSFSVHIAAMPRLSVDPDSGTGTGEWVMLVYYEMPDGPQGRMFGEYEDEYRRVNGFWKFATMVDTVHRDIGDGAPRLA